MPEVERNMARWLRIGLVVASAAALTVFVLALVSQGSDLAAVLALILAIPPAIPVMRDEWKRLQQEREPATSDNQGGSGSDQVPGAKPRGFRLALLLMSVGSGIILATLFWFIGGQADLTATPDVKLSQGANLVDGSRIELLDRNTGSGDLFTPPQRDNLAVKFTLHNTESTGFCAGAAEVKFFVAVDGEPVELARPDAITQSGGEVVLDLSAATREASVVVVISMEDKECRVNFRLDRVTLYN